MPPVVTRLTAKNLEQELTRTPYVLVRLERSPKPLFHRGLADSLDGRFPSLFSFGMLSRTDVRPELLEALFQTALGRLRGGIRDGYFLFQAGVVVGHHWPETRPDNVRYSTDGAAAIPDDAVTRDLARTSPREADQLRELLAYFVPIVERRQRAGGWSDTGSAEARPPTPPRPPPRPAAPAPGEDDPYAVLGLQPTASDDEVKDAWRTQLKLNHPDRVAHLSPALQKFAEHQTLAIKHAYETILAMRRK